MSFTCSVCKRRLTTRNSWIQHMTVQHSGGKLLAADTLKHLESNNYRPYKCNECKLTFKSSWQLRLHRLKHAGAAIHKLYTCSICGKDVKSKYKFKWHLFIHYRDEPHDHMEKDENSKKATTDSPLKVKCQLCRPSPHFTNSAEFKRHLKQHFDCGEFCCHICKKHFDTEKLLQ